MTSRKQGEGVSIYVTLGKTQFSVPEGVRKSQNLRDIIYSRFLRGSSTGLCQVGPAKVKSILFTEGSPEVKIRSHNLFL